MKETTQKFSGLSIAELKALQTPGVEHAQAALHLTLKELALLGWIKVTRASRPTPLVFYLVYR
jgi:hypothetical protein